MDAIICLLFVAWRRENAPRMRRVTPVGIVKNSASRRVYGCICGASESCCARYPVTQRVLNFIARHNLSCCPGLPGGLESLPRTTLAVVQRALESQECALSEMGITAYIAALTNSQ